MAEKKTKPKEKTPTISCKPDQLTGVMKCTYTGPTYTYPETSKKEKPPTSSF